MTSYQCDNCGKKCTSQSGLTLHLKKCSVPQKATPPEVPDSQQPNYDIPPELDNFARQKGFLVEYNEDEQKMKSTLMGMSGCGDTITESLANLKKRIGAIKPLGPRYYVLYCKISDDDVEGIDMEFPFMAGEAPTFEEAEKLARKVVNENKNVTIIPKIYKAEKGEAMETTMNKAKTQFCTLYKNMLESHKIYKRWK